MAEKNVFGRCKSRASYIVPMAMARALATESLVHQC